MKTETKIKITEFVFFMIFLLMIMIVTFLIVVIIKKNFGFNIPSYILLPFGTIILDSFFPGTKRYFKEKIKNYYEEEPYNKN